MKTLLFFLFVINVSPLIAQDIDMTQKDIEVFKELYNNHYTKSLQDAKIKSSQMLLQGRPIKAVNEICEKHRDIAEEIAGKLDKKNPQYYALMGTLTGSGDGKREGCLMALVEHTEIMNHRQEIARNIASATHKNIVKIKIFGEERQ